LIILLDNAIKHTHGSIRISAEKVNRQAEIKVQDTGGGISADILEHVFDRFFRGNTSRSQNGFGLGLPIAKSLVEGQGGTISITSELFKGSLIIIRLPLQED